MSHTLRYSAAFSVVFGALVSITTACGGSDATGGAVPTTGGAGGASSGGKSSGGGKGGTTGSGGTTGDAGEDGSGGTSTGSGGSGSGGKGGSSTGGTGGKGGSGGSGATATDDLLDEIEGHCERDCDAQYALDCAPASSNTLVCETSCVAQTAQLGDFCLREYADYVACRADGGYACISETQPYPNATCVVQQLAFSECVQHLGCKRDCQVAIEEGCTTEAHDTCLQNCIDEGAMYESTCGIYYEQGMLLCRATQGNPTCSGDHVATPATCAYYVLEIGSCVSDDTGDYCDGWCYAADQLGCAGDDCLADCQAKTMDATCGTAWNDMLDCAMFFGDAACNTDGVFMANGICDSEVTTYTTCASGAAGSGG